MHQGRIVKRIKCFHIKWSHSVFSSSSSLLKKLVFPLDLWVGELGCNKYFKYNEHDEVSESVITTRLITNSSKEWDKV